MAILGSFCVNTHSREFKNTSKRLDISEGQLDLILHEYMNQMGTEQYPSDEYILSKTLGIQQTNASENVIKVWDAEYSNPITFNTKEEYQIARNKAQRFFDNSAIGLRITADGKYVMTVAEPISEENSPLMDKMTIKGELGVNKQQLINLLGSKMYKGNAQSVAIKELTQNAFDAVKIAKALGQIDKGKIDIKLNKYNRTITVTDNGTGMTPEIVQKAFFTIGGSFKGDNVDNRLKSGGLGLAKMAFLFSSEYVDVTTVKDGKKTMVHATPEEIQNDNFLLHVSETDEPNGTTVIVKIPENYVDDNGEKKPVWFHDDTSFLKEPMIGDVEVTTSYYTGYPLSGRTPETSDKNKVPDGYIPVGMATSDFGDVEVYIKPKSPGSGGIPYKVLSSGLYQFSKYAGNWNITGRFEAIINIKPTVNTRSELYPINNQREGFNQGVKPEVDDIEHLLLQINRALERKSVAEAFNNTISMDVTEVSVPKRAAAPSDILNSTVKEVTSLFIPEQAKKSDNSFGLNSLDWKSIRTSKENEKARKSSLNTGGIRFNGSDSISSVDTSHLDINKPLFHNNTTMVIEEDGQKVLNEFGKLLMELKSLYGQTHKDSKILSRTGEDILEYISKQYWGVSFDKSYGGINVKPTVINLLAVNPFYKVKSYPGVDTALALTEYITHLIIHEFNHNYASGEGSEFTGRFPETYAEFAGIGKEFNKDWKNKLYLLIKSNLQTFKKYAERYEQSTNRGESFEGDNLYQREESKESGSIDDGRFIQGDRSGDNVQEDGIRTLGDVPISQAELYSGNAFGSDKAWGAEARKLGIKVTDYEISDYANRSEEEKDRIEREYIEVRNFLGKPVLSKNSNGGMLTRRDMIQADNADAIFAIAEQITPPNSIEYSGGRAYKNTSGHDNVAGGTANAVARGIIRGIPVYVYDSSTKQWKTWDSKTSSFVITEEPTLTPHAAVIGTRGKEKDAAGNPDINEEQKNVIRSILINSITQVAKTEEVKGPEKTVVEEAKTVTQKAKTLTDQIDTLIDSGISVTEIRDEANAAMDWVSDQLTQFLEDPTYLLDNGLIAGTDTYDDAQKDAFINKIKKMSRKSLLEFIGIDNLLNRYKDFVLTRTEENAEIFDNLDYDYQDRLDAIKENLSGLIQLGYSRFLEREGFGFVVSENEDTIYTVTDEQTIDNTDDTDNFSGDTDTTNSEEEGNQTEHWMIEQRTRAILDNASALIKQAVSDCFVLVDSGEKNPDGSVKYTILKDDVGRNVRVTGINATRSIVKWTQGALSLKGMIDRLKDKEAANPWISQIIQKLEDNTGKQSDFQNQFFTVFCKHFQPYSIVIKNSDGSYYTHIVNSHPALGDAMSQIKVQYSLNKLPLFNNVGVDARNLSTFNSFVEKLEGLGTLTNDNREDAVKYVGEILAAVGFPQPSDAINRLLDDSIVNTVVKNSKQIVSRLKNEIGNQAFDPFKYNDKNSVDGFFKGVLEPFTSALEDTMVSSVFDSGKMYQSYVTPSWTTKLFQKMHYTGRDFADFIKNEFATSEWFVDKVGEDAEYYLNPNVWRLPWMRDLLRMSEKERQQAFTHRVQLNFDKSNYMKGMTEGQYILSVLTEYASGNVGKGTTFANYRFPMLSNKPSNEFVSFIRYTDYYEQAITSGFIEIFNQEMSRIQTLMLRNKSKGEEGYIPVFEERGKKFQFLDYLNEFLDGKSKDTELGKLIRRKLNGEEVDLTALEQELSAVISKHLREGAEKLVAEYKANGIFEALKKVEKVGKSDAKVEAFIKEFYWNDSYAQANMLELFITDKAYYENEENLQKRLAQIHSPGMRGNPEARDYNNERVSDGSIRIVKLSDYKDIISSTLDNVLEVFDKKIAAANETDRAGWETLKGSVKSAFENINVVDGQAFLSPTSYRKIAISFGEWSQDAEDTYNALKEGKYNLAQLKSVFNPQKPFVYSKLDKQVSDDPNFKGPIKNFNFGVQYKCAAYLLIMADAIIGNNQTGRPNILRAIFNIMENSARENPTKGIDMVIFDSGVKTGLTDTISLKEFVEAQDGEDGAYGRILTKIYKDGAYNNNYVDTISLEDYAVQQQVPEHFTDHSDLQWGSQVRVVMPSDLETSFDGQLVEYEFYDTTTGETLKLSKNDLRKRWEETTARMIEININALKEELGLDDSIGDQRERNVILSKILQREILSNSRYGVDLLLACSVDENGEFRIPLGDPVQSNRVEQLLNSIIKNRVNKQKVNGGTLVEVSNFGTSKKLEVRFKDKNNPNSLLKSKAEYTAEGHTENEYKDYVSKNQGGIAYYECFAPSWTRDLFSDFTDDKGNIDVEAIELLNPDLLKMFGYRIPTEDKYSTAPYKIVGFLPKEAGDGFMQPWDTTVIDGSDFDVDKKYLMRLNLIINRTLQSKKQYLEDGHTEEEYQQYYLKNAPTAGRVRNAIYKDIDIVTSAESQFVSEAINKVEESGITDEYNKHKAIEKEIIRQMISSDYIHRNSNEIPKENRELFKAIKRAYVNLKYEVKQPVDERQRLNNSMFNMQWAIATHASTADKILNPGNFDQQKKMGYLVAAYRMGLGSWDSLSSMDIYSLKKLVFTDKNIMDFSTQSKFYKQNSVAGQILGIFAVAKSAHAMFESRGYAVKIDTPFTIDGMQFNQIMELDKMYDRTGVTLIGKTLGSLVGASADAVKDPVLNFMNINKETVNVLNVALRLGLDFDTASMLLSSRVVGEVLDAYHKSLLGKREKLDNIIKNRLEQLQKDGKFTDVSVILTEELTKDELIKGIKDSDIKTDYKILLAYQRLSEVAAHSQAITNYSRLNSVKSATGPLYIDTIMQMEKLDRDMEYLVKYRDLYRNTETDEIVKIGDVINGIEVTESNLQELVASGLIEKGFYEGISKETIFNDMPSLRQFYQGYGIAKNLFEGIGLPTAKEQFSEILNSLGSTRSVVLNDKKLMTSLADFFKSYIIVQNGVVDSNLLDYCINKFPEVFIKNGYKTKYANNPLIQAIQPTLADSNDTKSTKYVLKLETTGMEQSEKDALSAGWVQLEKDNPKLSHALFAYNFFRGGIGFTPKTFMSLVPLQVKEGLSGYVDTFRNIPFVAAPDLVDQWIRHNYKNNMLVPRKDLKNVIVISPKHPSSIKIAERGTPDYVKIEISKDVFTLYRKSAIDAGGSSIYTEVSTLGNDGEFIDIQAPSNISIPKNTELSSYEEIAENGAFLQEFASIQYGTETKVTRDTERLRKNFDDAMEDLEITSDKDKFEDELEKFC